MTKKEKLELFIELNDLSDIQAKKLKKELKNAYWARGFDFFLYQNSGRVTTGYDKDSNQFHMTYI